MRLPLLVVPTVLLVACGGTEPTQPVSIELVSGSGQTGIRGAELDDPIVVRVLGDGNQPFQGAIVSFTQSGFVLGFDTTDAAGLTQFAWTLTANTGSVTLSAEVAGLPPVLIPATALDPCLIDNPYVYGNAGTGELSSIDCLDGAQFFIDYHGFVFPGGAGEFLLSSGVMDTWIQLEDEDGELVAYNDDIDPGVITNSRVKAFLVDGVDYRFGATTFGSFETGAYTFSSAPATPDVTGCEEAWVVRGVTLNQTIAAGDCTAGAGQADVYSFVLPPNQSATIRMTSTAVDAFLHLESRFDGLLLEDDNSGGGTDARIVMPGDPSIGRIVDIWAGTAAAGQSGAYTFTVVNGTSGVSGVTAPSFPGTRDVRRLRERRWLSLLRPRPGDAPQKRGGFRVSGGPGW